MKQKKVSSPPIGSHLRKELLLNSGSNVIKLLKYARVFVPDRPFQPSLMFVGKARNIP
jgi:hypothetical protein